MAEVRNPKLRLLSFVVIFYLILAFSWWTFLLFTKNRDAFFAKVELQKISLVEVESLVSEKEFYDSQAYVDLYEDYRRQEWMILGEAVVFILIISVGIYLINRGYNKEVNAATQRRNFLLSITHELKSPIASIRLVLDTFLKRELKKNQTEQLTQSALRETERLNNLVNDLLLSARLETTYELNKEPIDLVSFCQELIDLQKTKYSNAIFEYHVAQPTLDYLGDVNGLSSVILNLLENAVKYSTDNPHIILKLSEQNAKITIHIMDHGIGIGEKEKKKIFQKFYRVGNEDTRKTKGTGLGLFIVSQIVLAHDGTIEVTDNSPKGSIFKITLPKSRN